jgi:hypothetical protein
VRRLALVLLILAPLQIVRATPCNAGQTDAPRAGVYCLQGYPAKLVDYPTWMRVPPTYTVTRALYQSPNIIERTAALKGYTLDGVEGFISLLSPAVVGYKVWIRLPGGAWHAVRVVDDAAQGDMYFHAITEGSGLELSYPLAQMFGALDWRNADGSRYPSMEICMTESDPTGVCTGMPADFSDWFLSTARYQ